MTASIVTFENPGAGDYRLASVTSLEVGGSFYDVDFVHGGSYDALQAALSPVSPITFTQTLADPAALKIALAVNAAAQVTTGATSLPLQIRVPYDDGTADVFFGLRIRTLDSPLAFSTEASLTGTAFQNTNFDPTGNSVPEWAIFTAVPEPSSFLLFLFGVTCVGNRRKKRNPVTNELGGD